MERWMEHYLELYSKESRIFDDALDTVACLSVMEGLGSWAEPLTSYPQERHQDWMTFHQRPSSAQRAFYLIIWWIYSVNDGRRGRCHRIWETATVTLYKNKADQRDCNSYRGTSMLNIVGKVFTRVVLGRLQKLAEKAYLESQCGFRFEHSTIDIIFSLQ